MREASYLRPWSRTCLRVLQAGGGVPAWSRGGVPAWSGGVYLPGLGGGVPARGVYLPGPGGVPGQVPPLWTE